MVGKGGYLGTWGVCVCAVLYLSSAMVDDHRDREGGNIRINMHITLHVAELT